MTALVWYVAYGSNMASERFSVYLRGGTPPGSTRVHPGARNPADPLADEPCRLTHRRFFAGQSRTWGGGGVAFVDPAAGSGDTAARRYLLTIEQFHDVWAQESGREVGAPMAEASLEPGTATVVGTGGYDRLLVVGHVDGVAMVTFTTPRDVASLVRRPPAEAYRAVVAAGLRQSHAMTADAANRVIEAEVAHHAPTREEPAEPADPGGR